MSAIAGAAAGGAIAGIIIGRNAAKAKEAIEKAASSWKSLETRGLALSVVETHGLATATGKSRPELHGELDGTGVAVRILTDAVHCARTEVSAQLASASSISVTVLPSPEGVLSKIRDWLHRDIEVGDPEFDPYFLVMANPESAAKELLSSTSIRERIASLAGYLAGFDYAKDRVLVTLQGAEPDPEIIGIALDLAAEAARAKL